MPGTTVKTIHSCTSITITRSQSREQNGVITVAKAPISRRVSFYYAYLFGSTGARPRTRPKTKGQSGVGRRNILIGLYGGLTECKGIGNLCKVVIRKVSQISIQFEICSRFLAGTVESRHAVGRFGPTDSLAVWPYIAKRGSSKTPDPKNRSLQDDNLS